MTAFRGPSLPDPWAEDHSAKLGNGLVTGSGVVGGHRADERAHQRLQRAPDTGLALFAVSQERQRVIAGVVMTAGAQVTQRRLEPRRDLVGGNTAGRAPRLPSSPAAGCDGRTGCFPMA